MASAPGQSLSNQLVFQSAPASNGNPASSWPTITTNGSDLIVTSATGRVHIEGTLYVTNLSTSAGPIISNSGGGGGGGGAGSGNVTGPGSSTSGQIATYNGTLGSTIQDQSTITTAQTIILSAGSGALIRPSTTGAGDLGSTSYNFNNIYCVSMTSSSGEARKMNGMPAPEAGGILDALKIKIYQWKVGGHDLIDGQIVPRPGKRYHWGCYAYDIKTAFEAGGREDFAAYKLENGEEGYDPGQIVWVTAKTLQETRQKLRSLEDRLSMLENQMAMR